MGVVCVDCLPGQLCEGDDCGTEPEAGGDPQRAVHRVHEGGASGSGDLVGLVAEVLAAVDCGADVVDQHAAIGAGQVRELVELAAHRCRVAGGGDAADDGDSECATELADGVV